MLKYIRIILAAAIFNPLIAAHAASFIEGMDDIPLPEGLSQITQDDISFGNEETRLLEAYLTAPKNQNAKKLFQSVGEFYQESLPQLGWIYQGNRGNNLLFYREGETLEVVKENDQPLLIRITLKTKP